MPQSPYGQRPGMMPLAPTRLPPANAAEPLKVALLVPLTGANAELGKAMLEAAQLALFETAGERLTLVPRDTAGTADGAANAARGAIGEGVKLILGPLLAPEVEAVKPLARDANVNVIAYSTATQLAGGNVFLMGFLPRQEVLREVAFARDRGLSRFAALVSNDQYGRLMADTLRDAAGSGGGTVTKVEFYDPRSPDAAVQRLVAAAKAGEAFDALLLPAGGDQLKQIARQLRQSGADAGQVRLLGSGLWDDPSIGGEPALYGGWFAAAPPDARRDFEGRFRSTYNRTPPRLASLAFDSAALAASLAKSGGPEPFSQQAILNSAGFASVDGMFRFAPDGLVQRGLAVLEVGPQGRVVASPPPRAFPELGY